MAVKPGSPALQLRVIGPLFIPSRGDTPNGRRVSFMTLLSELDRSGIRYEAADSNAYNHLPWLGRPLSALAVMANARRLAAAAGHVSFCGAGAGIAAIGGRLLKYTRRNGTRLNIRVSGGAFKDYYLAASVGERERIGHVMRHASAVFLQTQRQVEFFRAMGALAWWLPNSRPAQPAAARRGGDYARRFLFAGNVQADKGVHEVIELGERLGPGYQIDVFGPLMTGVALSDFAGRRTRYCGILPPADVAPAMAKYDALLLPTSWAGEGQPGVVIEALSVGVPSIASRHAGIPEVVVDGESGFLVAPRSVEALVDAVRRYERHDVQAMREQCLRRFRLFDSGEQTRLFLQRIGLS